jgi:hypothetical protein
VDINGTTLAILVGGAMHQVDIRLIPLPGNRAIDRVTLNGKLLDRSAWNPLSGGILMIQVAL